MVRWFSQFLDSLLTLLWLHGLSSWVPVVRAAIRGAASLREGGGGVVVAVVVVVDLWNKFSTCIKVS